MLNLRHEMKLPTILTTDNEEETPPVGHSPKDIERESKQPATVRWVYDCVDGHRIRCDARKATAALKLWIAAAIGALTVMSGALLIVYYSLESVIYTQTKAVVVEVTPEIVRKIVREELDARSTYKSLTPEELESGDSMPTKSIDQQNGWTTFPRKYVAIE